MKKRPIVLLSALCALCFSAGVFAACSDGATTPATPTPPPIGPSVEDHVSTIEVGDVRIQLLSDTLVRIEDRGPKGFENRPSYIVSNRSDWEPVEYTMTLGGGETVISTANYVVHIPQGGSAEEVYVRDGEGEELYDFEGTTDTNVYLPSPSDELKSWYFTDSPRIIPSEYGYSVNEEGGPLQDWDFDNNATDIYVFLPQNDYVRFCDDYTDLTGKSEMVSMQMLGFWDSRWYAYSAETALQQIKDYTDRGYSIDVLVIDTDWRTAASGTGYEINTELFPDMAGFLEQCHALGVNVIFNDHPEPITSGNGLDKEEVGYRNENLTLILSMGLDYWWYDRNWSVSLNSFDPDISVFAFGMYAYNWVTQEYLESITDLNEYAERALIMGNVDGCLHGKWNYASDISAHRYSIQWTGDIGSTSDALAQEIYASVFGGAEVGIPYMSSDIGGHTQPVTDSMYVRWFQYGALSSILRVHCTNASYIGQEGRMPWLYGETAEEVAHSYMDMRYRLLPVYYSLSRENFEGGLPVMRRLDIEYPEYVEASRNDEYLLGDYVLVAPIAEATPNVTVDDSRLTHQKDGVAMAGLQAKYYNNSSFQGAPVKTTVDKNIDFDWKTGGPAGLGSDNFSIEWTGDITIGSAPARLMFFADDHVKVWVDDELVIDSKGTYDNYLTTEKEYAAGSKHSLRVQYAEEGGNAHVSMYYVESGSVNTQYNTRTVFLPEGSWIDVWSGERYAGPATIEVSHTLLTSPIFVREGALIPLARNMKNTSEKDWSELTLDVYPSTNFTAEAMLYEDDTTTVAYKHGEYRKTDIAMRYDEGKGTLLVDIGAAQGKFNGKLAFTERTWNVRVHKYADWGAIEWVRVNGKYVSVQEFVKSSEAQPFAYSGAALDSDIAQFTFRGSVYEAYSIEIKFASAEASAVNADYDRTAVKFSLDKSAAGGRANFDELGTHGWTIFGEKSGCDPTNKSGEDPLIKYVGSYDTPWIVENNFFTKVYTEDEVGKTSTNAIASQKDFSIELKTTGEKLYYVLFVGGNQGSAKLSVRDRAGNVQTVTFGNIEGRFMRRVVIEVEAGTPSTLYVTYSALASETSGTGTPTYLTFLGGYVGTVPGDVSENPQSTATAEIEPLANPAATVDLSDAGADLNAETLDWAQFSEDGKNPERRLGGEGIESVTFSDGRGFGDYSARIAYSDGTTNGAHTGTTNGTCTPGSITANFLVDTNVRYIRLYTGAFQATNIVEVYDVNGKLLAKSTPFTAGGTAETRVVTIAVSVKEQETITVIIRSTNEGGGGNVSLAAIALLGEFKGESVVALNAQKQEVSGNIDLTAAGSADWKYIANGAEKENADAISALTFSAYTNDFEDYAATFSYTDGGSETGLRGGRECDFVRFTVKVDASTAQLDLYVSAAGNSTAGIVVLDSAGRAILREQPVTSGAEKTCALVRLTVQATAEEELTVICYKGGSAGGRFGLAAIALANGAQQ